ncbi:MAG: M23 family metallopeptidase [Firmicutes bacterium]|nr:M23 family metallopeptidase [Bacillota bacterium]
MSAGSWSYARHVAYRVTVDGVEAGVVASPAVVSQAIQAEAERRGFDPNRVVLVESVRTRPFHSLWRPHTLDAQEMAARLSGRLTFQLQAADLVIDGRRVLTLPDRQTAEAAVAKVRADYLAWIGAGREGVTVQSVEPMQKIEIRVRPVDPDTIVTDLDQAVALLERGTDKQDEHTVAKGETLWQIAQEHHLSPEEILAANPGLQPSLLQVGQKVNLVVPEPYITFRDTEIRVQKVSIPYATQTVKDPNLYPWQRVTRQAGQPGVKEVTTQIVREAGRIVSADVVSTAVIEPPVQAVVAVGTKAVPAASGTGVFVWPTSGGVITSPFGWRWGTLHPGVDIGVPIGTPVYAADSGTVVAAGWESGYGKRVIISHGRGLVTVYGHLSSIRVQAGQEVRRGQLIGLSGMTGHATGPHLHFEVRVNGAPVNPVKYLK